jgi:aminopeptidase N
MTSTPRQRGRGREVMAKAAEMMTFYSSLVGEAPYPGLSIAVLESQVPGGHAPGYVAIVNQPLPTSPFVWRDDPASFDEFPDFFVAHEIAHQWWGQAIGWQNYHEQWLSEGFSQYFAALFAERHRGPGVFEDVMRQCARWTMSRSDQGPVYLGYRLGHFKGDGRIFRALVYNKGGAVLHMLRRMLGDDVFFAGVRRFYQAHKYRKTGTEALKEALEAEAGRQLDAFFEGWIYGQDLPELTVSWQTVDAGARVRIDFRQAEGRTFEFPVTVTRVYRDRSVETETLTITAATATIERPLKGALRSVQVNQDRLTPVKVKD